MWNWQAKAFELQQAGTAYALITITECHGSSPRNPGAKMIVLHDGSIFGTIGGGRLEELVIEDAQASLKEAIACTGSYPLCIKTGQCCGGAVKTLIEVCGVGPQLFVFGAGHVGQSLAQTLEGTPFQVHLIDQRQEWIQHQALPKSVIRHEQSWQEFVDQARWHRLHTYAIVMTHDHQLDLEIVAALVQQPACYIGLIGSETKWQRFQQRLRAKDIDADAIGRIHCPVGLQIGGKAPREVAVSIAAELLQEYYRNS